MTEQERAQRLAAWLDAPAGTEPPDHLDAEVVGAVYALRPDLAPAPRVSLDDILSGVTEGPFAAGGAREIARTNESADPDDRVVSLADARAARRGAPPKGATGPGELGRAAAASLSEIAANTPAARPARRWWASPIVGVAFAAAAAALFVVPRVAGLRSPQEALRAREEEASFAPAPEPPAEPDGIAELGASAAEKAEGAPAAALATPASGGASQPEVATRGRMDSVPASRADGAAAPMTSDTVGRGGLAGRSGREDRFGGGAEADGLDARSESVAGAPADAASALRDEAAPASRAADAPAADAIDAAPQGYGSGAAGLGTANGPWRAGEGASPKPTAGVQPSPPPGAYAQRGATDAEAKKSKEETARPSPVASSKAPRAPAASAPAEERASPVIAEAEADLPSGADRARQDAAAGRAIAGYADAWWRAAPDLLVAWSAAEAEPDPRRAATLFGALASDSRAWVAQDAAARQTERLLRAGSASDAVRVADAALARSATPSPYRARLLLARARALDAAGRTSEADAAYTLAGAAAGW